LIVEDDGQAEDKGIGPPVLDEKDKRIGPPVLDEKGRTEILANP
jgi:hypothetical protein